MNKKAQAEAPEMTKYAFFYLPLTAAVIIGLIVFTTLLVGQGLIPVSADQVVQVRQVQSQLWKTDENTGRTSPFEYDTDLTTVAKTITQKKMAYSVSIDGKEVKHQEKYYDVAKPIAPHRSSPYTEIKNVKVDGQIKELKIEAYYPYKYETKTT